MLDIYPEYSKITSERRWKYGTDYYGEFPYGYGSKKRNRRNLLKMGLTMTSAINVFLSKVRMERRIPFEITADADPFYSESNIRHLERIMADIESGKERFAEHELTED